MTSIRGIHIALLALFVAVAVSSPAAQAFDDELTGEHLKSLLPEDVPGYTLDDVDVKTSSPSVRGVYTSNSEDATINLAVHYGKNGAEKYREARGKFTMGAAKGKLNTGSFSVQDQTFVSAHLGDRFIAMAYFNHFLVGVNAKEHGDPEPAVGEFLETIGLDRFKKWSPPQDLNYSLAKAVSDVPDCFDMDCFSEHVSRCEEAQVIGTLGRRITAVYTIEEEVGDQCQISLVFSENPNPEWENTPLYFTLNPADGFSMDDVKGVIDDCVQGEQENYNCSGPLLDRIKDR